MIIIRNIFQQIFPQFDFIEIFQQMKSGPLNRSLSSQSETGEIDDDDNVGNSPVSGLSQIPIMLQGKYSSFKLQVKLTNQKHLSKY